MKLSTKSRYGLRAMLCLAGLPKDEVVMVRAIAASQNLPETYLEQLMRSLRIAGLLTAVRGAHGGYTLAHKPEQITLAQVVEALDGPVNIADCSEVANCCFDPANCALKEAFAEVNDVLCNVLKGITLADLAQRQRAKSHVYIPMYHI